MATLQADNSQRIKMREDDRKIQARSAFWTALVMALLLLLCIFYIVTESTIPPPDEVRYETVGSVDFGDANAGSSNVENFNDPSPTPSKADPGAKKPSTTKPTPNDNPVFSGGDKSTTPPEKPANPDPAPNPNPKPGGGSNQGGGDSPGNQGNTSLPLPGNMSWGTGKFGLGKRLLKYYVKPQYPGKGEEKITFLITINPNGSVQSVDGIGINADLIKAGETAIKKWKFNPIPTNEVQQVKVVITFNQTGGN